MVYGKPILNDSTTEYTVADAKTRQAKKKIIMTSSSLSLWLLLRS